MSFFNTLLQSKNCIKHDGRPFWKYKLSTAEFESLKNEIGFAKKYRLDPRDAALYYAEWWRNNYCGGIPCKDGIFKSIGGNIKFEISEQEFYKLARKGAQMLGITWIKKQNTLYFKTLLLQGGLPLTHISENKGKYKDFLLAVLEEQPESLEDFIFNQGIINLLPKSSQNDIVYENCFEIVKSILDNEDTYDELLGSSESLKEIAHALKVCSKTLIKKERLSKPKNYWLLSFKEDKVEINLKIGLQAIYTAKALANVLGFENMEKTEYQLFVNEELICVFRKLSNGSYKTDWFEKQNQKWNSDSNLPHTYIIENGVKTEVKDFIQTVPNKHMPSLWAQYSDKEWRLIKGNGAADKEAAVLFPNTWNCSKTGFQIDFYGTSLSWLKFEGEISLDRELERRKYLSNVASFDWTIISQKPSWMLKANMPVVSKKPKVIVYDENNTILSPHKYKVFIKKHKSYDQWKELADVKFIQAGCIDIKIERNGLIAYDTIYNIDSLQLRYTSKTITKSEIVIENKAAFDIELKEGEILDITQNQSGFTLTVDTKLARLPKAVQGAIKFKNEKKLFFELDTPFEGIAILDKDGAILSQKTSLAIGNLYGLRVLSSSNAEAVLKISNKVNKDVIISKELEESSTPLITFIDEIKRLYYLDDAMNHLNKVTLELIEGRVSKSYEVSGFTYSLNVEQQFDSKVVVVEDTNADLDLFAIPLSEDGSDLTLIPLMQNDSSYEIPKTSIANQFIVISSKDTVNRLLPRFVNTDEYFEGLAKKDRIDNYLTALEEPGYTNNLWSQIVACFKICTDHEIPFSTFDQLRTISRSSEVAAKAFFFIGEHQSKPEDYIHKYIPELEKDLGFCFHWIQKEHWEISLAVINERYAYKYLAKNIGLLSSYMLMNELPDLLNYLSGGNITSEKIQYQDIMTLRGSLGERVLKELPYGSPKITSDYNIRITEHAPVKLLLKAPIAVAESINNLQEKYPIWAGNEFRETIRRNIQYSQYLNKGFYNKVVCHALKNS
jgi:hypothetical protein